MPTLLHERKPSHCGTQDVWTIGLWDSSGLLIGGYCMDARSEDAHALGHTTNVLRWNCWDEDAEVLRIVPCSGRLGDLALSPRIVFLVLANFVRLTRIISRIFPETSGNTTISTVCRCRDRPNPSFRPNNCQCHTDYQAITCSTVCVLEIDHSATRSNLN